MSKILKPLISIVIAFVPQSSCEELIALHDAGYLDIIPVDPDSTIKPDPKGGIVYSYKDESGAEVSNHFEAFINCVGQPALDFEEFPFKSLLQNGDISKATVKFRDASRGQKELEQGNKSVETTEEGEYILNVPGLAITDDFQVVDDKGKASEQIYMMAVPYIGGYNPDYSGLDFCEEASGMIIKKIAAGLS